MVTRHIGKCLWRENYLFMHRPNQDIQYIYSNTVSLRITVLWKVSILFTSSKCITLYKNSPRGKLITTKFTTLLKKFKLHFITLPFPSPSVVYDPNSNNNEERDRQHKEPTTNNYNSQKSSCRANKQHTHAT